jgi:predicted nucleotidyltransferase
MLNDLMTPDMILTGSRFFGNANEDSDYDFYKEYSKEAEEDLIKKGFWLLPTVEGPYISDGITTVVYRYKTDEFQMDVQLVVDIHLKNTAQELLHDLFPRGIPKWKSRQVWKATIRALMSARKQNSTTHSKDTITILS